jgi:small-conductance mechanosensitive channel
VRGVTTPAAVLPVLPALQVALSDAERDACGEDPSAACLAVFRWTDSEVLAQGSDWLLAKPVTVAFILLLAVVVNRLLRRAIGKFIRSIQDAPVQRGLETIRSRTPGSLITTGPVQMRAAQRAGTIGGVLRSITSFVVWTVAALTALGQFGINLGPLIAGAGIVGIALGFGAQSLVRDFLSGIFMLIEDQFGVGDIIDAGEATGTVEGVSLRSTRLRDVNGVVWHIPNGEIRRVGNKSQEWSRALLDIEVAYATDLDHAQAVIKGVADGLWREDEWSDKILEEPEVWGVEVLGASGISLRLVIKTTPAAQWTVMRELRGRIKSAFDAEGIEIPFPQQTVWFRNPAEPTGDGEPPPPAPGAPAPPSAPAPPA